MSTTSNDAGAKPGRAPMKPYLSGSAFMGITELAKLMGTTRDRVSGKVADGEIPPCFLRVGERQRWQRAHVQEWMRTGEWPKAAWKGQGG